jgi:hypothetical protein
VADFLTANFTGTLDTNLTGYTSDSGGSWTKHPNWSGDLVLSGNGRCYFKTAGNTVGLYYASETPASADYTVTGVFRRLSGVTGQEIGVMGRVSTTNNEWYWARWSHANTRWELYRGITLIGNVADTWTDGTDKTVELVMAGDQISVKVGGSTVIGPVTDGTYSAAGKAAVVISGAVSASTTGYHIDSVTAGDGAASLAAGTASVTSYGLTVATVTATDATGGTEDYDYQWYLDTTPGFAPSGANDVPGATSLTANLTGLTRGQTYYAKVVYDDGVDQVTSNEVSFTTKDSLLVIDGNSQATIPGSAGATAWGTQLADILPANWHVVSVAESAKTIRDRITAIADVTSLLDAANAANVVVLDEIINSAYGPDPQAALDAADIYADLTEYSGEVWGVAGAKLLILGGQPQRGDFPGTSTIAGADPAAQEANFTAVIDGVYDLLEAGWWEICDGYDDQRNDRKLADRASDFFNQTDDVHRTTAGQLRRAINVSSMLAMVLNPNPGGGGSGPVPMIGSPLIRSLQ